MKYKYDSATPYTAAFVIFRKNDKIAFLLRQNTGWEDGLYDLPSGKVENDESFTVAAIREGKEETGANLKPENLRYVLTAHRKGPGIYWAEVLFEAKNWEGELYNAEPHKHGALEWFNLHKLPDNVVPSVRYYLEQIQAGKQYAEYGW